MGVYYNISPPALCLEFSMIKKKNKQNYLKCILRKKWNVKFIYIRVIINAVIKLCFIPVGIENIQ